ncbi:uncharacterized protein LOC143465387 [Clavelina lepadiformis]|uniref:uncharacterized protein LOC143465387 n=1 Tax=Clavelina lepadiformis TaxID=159417 RepID=UPI0040419644
MTILPAIALGCVAIAVLLDLLAAVSPGWTVIGEYSSGTMYECLAGGSCSSITPTAPTVLTAIFTFGALIPLGVGLTCMVFGMKNKEKSKYTIGSVFTFIAALILIIGLAIYGISTIVHATTYGYSFYIGWAAVILGGIGGGLGLVHSLRSSSSSSF